MKQFLAAILLAIGICTSSAAQSMFEVASIKPVPAVDMPHRYPYLRHGAFKAENAPLKALLVVAYGLTEPYIIGPDWLNNERYDIAAKAPDGVPDSEIKPLLQSLLKDRFHLESHFETREMPAYDMTIGKSGSKLIPFDPSHPPRPPRILDHGQRATAGMGTADQLAFILSGLTGRPVINKTGLEGRFGWALTYTHTPLSTESSAADSTAPDLLGAVEQQLGLKLEFKKEPIPVVVVDHIDRLPTEN